MAKSYAMGDGAILSTRRALLSGALLLAMAGSAQVQAQAQAQRRILVFGDSNTFGLMPLQDGRPRQRYASTARWTGVLRAELGPDVAIVEDGLIGRSIDRDEPSGLGGGVLRSEHFNGERSLPMAVASQAPLDLVVIMLGTNDVAAKYGREVDDIARSLIKVAREAPRVAGVWLPSSKPPKVLVVTPPPISADIGFPPFRQLWPDGAAKSLALRGALARSADSAGIAVVHAGDVITTAGPDGIHLTPENHAALGRHVAIAARRLLAP